MKKLALHWKILLGMLLGVLFGLGMSYLDAGPQFVKDWIKPFGTIFINLLKLVAVPLILASIIKGIADMKDITKLSKIGGRTFVFYIFTTVFAVALGLIMVNIFRPGDAVKTETRESLISSYTAQAGDKIAEAEAQKGVGPLQPLVDVFPDNVFKAATDNRAMLQVIAFAVLFGIGLILVAPDKSKPLMDFFDSMNEVILKIIDVIMMGSPIGVFSLLAALIVEAPSADIFVALGLYAITILVGLAILIGLFYPTLIYIFTKRTPKYFFKGISPAQLVAFSTSSSAATLPVTMERVEEHLGVEKEVAGFVLPLGATVNMDGTALYQAVAAVFIAQAFGMDLSLTTQLGIIVTATLASIGSAAVPSAGMVMLVIVLGQAGIPEAGLALIFAIDRPLDMCRTIANVTSDACVAVIVANSVGMLKEPNPHGAFDDYKPGGEA
jgi:Na+/H+-dicarboxylate symporter